MKIAFFQALLLGAAQAVETMAEIESEASYWPDLLVQTASIVDFFYPSNEVETPATYLAEIEAEEPTVLAEVAAEVEQKAPKAAKDAVQAVKNAKKANQVSDSSSDGSESDSSSASTASSASSASSESEGDSSGSSDEGDSSSTESEGEAVPAKPKAPAAAAKAATVTKSIDGLMVTHPTGCGCPQASKCCKKPGDPLKKAIGILEADEENKKDEWQPETSTKTGKQEPVTICNAECDADLEEATDEQLSDELAAIDTELATDELQEQAYEAAW